MARQRRCFRNTGTARTSTGETLGSARLASPFVATSPRCFVAGAPNDFLKHPLRLSRPAVTWLVVTLPVLLSAGPSTPPPQDTKQAPALKGYCPASYLLAGKAVKGDPAHQAVYMGEVYYLANAEAKKAFDADPLRYLPQFGGLCATVLGGTYGRRVPGDPEIFEVVDGKVYLFVLERARKNFREEGTEQFIATARKRFNEPRLRGYCPVCYQLLNRAVLGGPKFKVIYRAGVYHLATPEAKEAFLKDPKKYAPQYEGFCAVAMASNRRIPANPALFAVVDGKTYLFRDTKSKQAFRADPSEFIKKADANWRLLKDRE